MEALLLLAAIIVAAIFFLIKGAWDERGKKEQVKERIHEAYGKEWKREYSEEELGGIFGFYEAHRRENQIDDITWNDLSMDEIFFRLNHTYSSAGQEYLYYALRTPALSAEEQEGMEERLSWIDGNEREREQLQLLFWTLGRSGKYSVYDYLGYLDGLGERSSGRDILMDVLLFASLLLIPFEASVGMMLFFIVITVNMFTYMKEKRRVEPYLVSFAYVKRILDFAKEIQKVQAPGFAKEWKELKELEGRFGKFRYSAVLGMRGSNTAGDPLSILLDYINMLLHLDIICFNAMFAEVKKHLADIDRMIELVGRTEALLAVASYRASLKEGWCRPVFSQEKNLSIRGLYHPLLKEPVKNDIRTHRGVLVTGSNASGKSTFLKAVALNALLAQTIGTCTAESYQGGFWRIYTSMALRDDLESGESYYIVEIGALKRILDVTAVKTPPVLCFVDEVLRGTNTVERIAASTQILKSLSRENVMCFAATHDIELTRLLQEEYDNYHFEEQVGENDISFNYVLMPGRATTRNAIRLLGIMGYDEEIIREADAMAARFMRTGEWEPEHGNAASE